MNHLKMQRNTIRRIIWTSLFFVVMVLILSLQLGPKGLDWEVNQVATRDVESDRYLTFVDEEATLAKQEEALQGFQDIYKIDLEKYNNITILSISDYFAELEQIIATLRAQSITQEEAMKQIHGTFDFSLNDEEWEELLSVENAQLQQVYDKGIDYATAVMSQGVTEENIAAAKEKIIQNIQNDRRIRSVQKAFLQDVVQQVKFYPTYVYDQEATAAKKAEVLATVEAEKIVVQKGELVIRKGEILTSRQISILKMLGYTTEGTPWMIMTAIAFIVAIIILIVRAYIRKYAPKIYEDERQLVLLMLLVAIVIASFRLFLSLTLSPVAEQAAQVGYLLPVATGTMLIAMLLDTRVAILVNLIYGAVVGLYTESIPFTVVALFGGLVGIIGVSNVSQRSDISLSALHVAIVNAITIVSIGVLNNQARDIVFTALLFGVANGFISSIFTIGLLPYLESVFGITSSIKLLELANPNQPLLKKLLSEAPGTYHHCVMVGNLGEAAADAIGANGLLVRLGAYYHDIGKLKRPYFFAENQLSGENPHDNITPQLSTLIITSHVKDGVDMATEEKLPPVILDLIAQHHGNSLITYFYYKAKNTDPTIKESDYRYEQRKPQTKEAAILMLADTVEAAVRSQKDATPGQLEGFIRNLIKDKLNDGQFDECELTFRDLDQIANAFVRVVNGIYHKRIEYPNQETMMEKAKRKGEQRKWRL